MKKLLLSLSFVFALIITSCGPAAENRDYMQMRAKTIADSMANLIKSAMAEAEMPGYTVPGPKPVDTTAQKTNTAVNTPK